MYVGDVGNADAAGCWLDRLLLLLRMGVGVEGARVGCGSEGWMWQRGWVLAGWIDEWQAGRVGDGCY